MAHPTVHSGASLVEAAIMCLPLQLLYIFNQMLFSQTIFWGEGQSNVNNIHRINSHPSIRLCRSSNSSEWGRQARRSTSDILIFYFPFGWQTIGCFLFNFSLFFLLWLKKLVWKFCRYFILWLENCANVESGARRAEQTETTFPSHLMKTLEQKPSPHRLPTCTHSSKNRHTFGNTEA